MGNITPGIALLIGILLLIILMSRAGRMLLGIAVVIALLFVAKSIFIRDYYLPSGGTIELQPTWAGFCNSTDGAAILKVGGAYVLTSNPGTAASGTCADIRFWAH